MSGEGRSTTFEDVSSPQHSTAYSNIPGDYSGNNRSNNIENSGNTTNNYYGGTNSPPRDSKILRCLYTSKYGSHRHRIRKPAEGTCVWVTEHPKYQEWLGKQTSGLLWLSADPGCGKSVTASFLVTHLATRTDAIVCYFFFKDDYEEQKNATFALSAILHQLFSGRDTLCRFAEEPFEKKGKSIAEEVDTLWDILVKSVTEGGCGQVICVVDALDECEEGTLAQFIRCLASLPGGNTPDIPLKFLLTGRPYHRIERELDLRATTIRLRGEDDVTAISADVTRVIDEGIKDLELYWRQPGRFGYLRELLESSADRTFLWVSLILGILKESVDDSREAFTSLVSNAPRNLAELYTRMLDKSNDPEQARRILHIVVAAARPLTLRETIIACRIGRNHKTINDIGDISPRSEATVKNLCGLFVRIIDSKVYLVHQTAREFLIKGSLLGYGNWQYTLCPIDSSFILADICISYLSLQEFETDPLVIDPAIIGEAEALVHKKEATHNYSEKYGLIDYAASYWARHCRDSRNRGMELFEFTTLICKRGSNRLLTWLRLYWENSGQPNYYPFPHDFTHLMIAAWFGQQSIVKRLLEQKESVNDRAEGYGTAVNVAALQKEKEITRMLLEGRVYAYLNGKEYNILLTRRSELKRLPRLRLRSYSRSLFSSSSSVLSMDGKVIEFLLPFSIQGIRDLHTLPSRLINSLP